MSDQLRDEIDRMTREQAAAIAAAHVPTEAELRDVEVPWIKTPEDLSAYIAALVNRPHDYGTCVYALSLSAVAAFHYVAHVLGVTGFQASCADLDILKRTRGLKGPFLILDGEKLLYPQYDLRAQLEEFLTSSRQWAADEAKKKLAEADRAHPNVRAHWESLVDAGREP